MVIDRKLLPNICLGENGQTFSYDGERSPLEQVISATDKSLFLCASGGIGKTTSLRAFWLDFLRGKHNIPCIYIDLKFLIANYRNDSIRSYIQGINQYKIDISQFTKNASKPILLLDGANEAPIDLIKEKQEEQ